MRWNERKLSVISRLVVGWIEVNNYPSELFCGRRAFFHRPAPKSGRNFDREFSCNFLLRNCKGYSVLVAFLICPVSNNIEKKN